MICRSCSRFTEDDCKGITDDEAPPAECINDEFCSSEPVKALRKTQREAHVRIAGLLRLVKDSYPPPKTA